MPIKQTLPVIISIALLSACGGSDGGSSGLSTGIEIDENLKGPESEPELAPVNAEDVDSISINTQVSGYIDDGGLIRFRFNPLESGKVIVTLSSEAEDLDLWVSGGGFYTDTYNDGSSGEVVLFDGVANVDYAIRIESYQGAGEFTLKVAQANREILGLSANEFLTLIDREVLGDCGSYIDDYDEAYYVIANWANGYYMDVDGSNKKYASSSDGNTVVFNDSHSESEEGYSYSYEGTATYTVDPGTGFITGTDIWSYIESYDGDITECSYEDTITGEIVL